MSTTKTLLLTGNTYPVRDKIKALGGIWNPVQKGWMVPADKYDEAASLVKYAPPADHVRPVRRERRGSHYARFQGGGEWYQNRRGRCEDAPCCGCCS